MHDRGPARPRASGDPGGRAAEGAAAPRGVAAPPRDPADLDPNDPSAWLGPAPRRGGRFAIPGGRRRPGPGAIVRYLSGRGERDPHDRRPRLRAIPVARPRHPLDDARPRPAITWLGHASALLTLAGRHLLFDPVWFAPPGVPRRLPPPLPLEAVAGRPLTLLVSHNHYDHLCRRTVAALHPETEVLCPLGLGRFFSRRGLRRVRELDWWDAAVLGDLEVTLVPAQHWSRRGLADENRTLWGGFVVRGEGRCVYFAGDSGFSAVFEAIGRRVRPDVALLPIGAYAPRWFMRMQHICPREALDALEALDAPRLLPIHWGVFRLSAEPPGEPPAWIEALARERGMARRVTVWPVGGTVDL